MQAAILARAGQAVPLVLAQLLPGQRQLLLLVWVGVWLSQPAVDAVLVLVQVPHPLAGQADTTVLSLLSEEDCLFNLRQLRQAAQGGSHLCYGQLLAVHILQLCQVLCLVLDHLARQRAASVAGLVQEVCQGLVGCPVCPARRLLSSYMLLRGLAIICWLRRWLRWSICLWQGSSMSVCQASAHASLHDEVLVIRHAADCCC